MEFIQFVFWLLLFFIAYSYIIYPLIIWTLTLFFKVQPKPISDELPTITLFVTAYNEADYVKEKIENSLALEYPKEKLNLVWVTDGSNDNTSEILKAYPQVTEYFEPMRNGKTHAMNRGMQFITTDIVVFSDANTHLNKSALLAMAQCFNNQKVGCVAGEKRIELSLRDNAAASGEGLYWKYESWVKKLDSRFYSCVGAAGELFAIRTHLFFPVKNNTILDDFIISMKIALKGYIIDYCPDAYASESASASVNDEMKRKIRIAAGSFQAIQELKSLFNFSKYPKLGYQYLSHKFFRWVIIPLSLALLLPLNLFIIFEFPDETIYTIVVVFQLTMYLLAFLGFLFRKQKMSFGFFFAPYYFVLANLAMYLGFYRFIKGKQPAQWEKVNRSIR